jgi:hypothetical protein
MILQYFILTVTFYYHTVFNLPNRFISRRSLYKKHSL